MNRFLPRPRLADELDVRGALKQGHDPLTEEPMVINEDYADRLCEFFRGLLRIARHLTRDAGCRWRCTPCGPYLVNLDWGREPLELHRPLP